MAKVTKAQTEAKTQHQGQEEATKRHAAEVQKLTEKLAGQIAAQDLVLAQGEKLTPMQKQALDLMVQLRDGTLRLTDAEKHRLTQQLETILANERWIATPKAKPSSRTKSPKTATPRSPRCTRRPRAWPTRAGEAARAEPRAQLGAGGYAALQVQRLLDTAAQLEQTAATSDQSAELREQAGCCASAPRCCRMASCSKAKAAADEWAKTTDQIGQGLTDSPFRAFEAGRGFSSTLWQGIVNTFKTTILQPTIRAILAPVTGGIRALFGDGAKGWRCRPPAAGFSAPWAAVAR